MLFDGKIGIWPFTELVPAKRNSKNREAGTLELKPIESITKQVTKHCFINKMIPAIKLKWPAFASKVIFIQQDNARPHIKDDDPDFRQRKKQSLQTENVCNNVEELVATVEKSYEDLSPTTLNNVFLSLQGCMVEMMKVKGHNAYKIPHMKKGTLIRQNELPINLEVSSELVKECLQYLVDNGCEEGMGIGIDLSI
ncbi:uncharacterized protein LOC131007986 [Salvia miltiorrhiza]|uniref:uncharacterized protein LOC131007986 n=1 Tax=Salvia miltiorrhiza TaxID=226208 RepID=UPI0025ABD637|nr:uncharacterized protein LOC131007986 [Salvia miltiorrhiza]